MMMVLLFVTGSTYKAPQVQEWIRDFDSEITIQHEQYDLCEHQSLDIEEVARQKAEDAWHRFQKPLIIDDMGVFFADYPLFPGTFTRYIVRALGLDGLWKLLDGNPCGRYEHCIAYVDADGVKLFKGRVEGTFIKTPRTSGVHARAQIDRIFIPDGSEYTISELEGTEELKKFHSRYRALEQLVSWLHKSRK